MKATNIALLNGLIECFTFDLKFETYFLTENIFSQKTMILVLVTYQEKIRFLFHKEMDTTHFEINSV